MESKDVPFAVADVATWTLETLKFFVGQNKHGKPKCYFSSFFNWSEAEYSQAKQHAITELERQPFNANAVFPTAGSKAKLRHVIQKKLVREHPELFVDRHGSDQPECFVPELISAEPSADQPYNSKNVTQQFIAAMNLYRKAQKKNNIQYNHEDDEDEDDSDDSDQPQTKRKHNLKTERATPYPVITSMSIPPSPATTIISSQTSETGKPPGGLNILNQDRIELGQATTTLAQDHSSHLILYITRVMIVEQQLVLNRQRFGIVENLFDQNRLDDLRFEELLFGCPLDDKPTFLWFFHKSASDKPRAIRNRPNAEAAIILLRARAERVAAEAIQLFDALDCDIAGLLPAHEVTRTTNFTEYESFELEIDNEGDDNEPDSETAFKVDSAYGSRNGESRLDNEMAAEETDAKPIISVEERPQQHQGKQKVDSESESESDEDEDISRFYR